jgi:hypothetical protein
MTARDLPVGAPTYCDFGAFRRMLIIPTTDNPTARIVF